MTNYNYIDSKVEWLGEVPEGWEIKKISSQYILRNEKVSDMEYQPLSVTMRGILPQLETVAKTDAHDARRLVKKGDFAINSRSDRRGACGMSDYDGSVSLINTVLTPRREICPQYFNWLFHTEQFADEFYKNGHGIVDDLWTTKWDEMKRIMIPVPCKGVQEKIAEYLDAKVDRIDAIISEAKTSIEEYKAWKASIIYEAVTKGLDPNAEMRRTNSNWLIETPLENKISRVGLHYDIILGKMLCPEQVDANYTLEPYFCAANVHFSGIDTENLKEMWFNPKEKEIYKVKQGDLLVVEGGAGAGGSAIVMDYNRETYVQNSIMIVRGRRENSNGFLKYVLECLVGRGYVDYACNKATIPHFTKEKLENTPYPVFSTDTQKRIVKYLDERCNAIDALIEEKEELISNLEAYKKSLIFEVVTGKRRVC